MGRAPYWDFYLQAPRRNRVIVLEDLNFIWDELELQDIAQLWQKGVNVAKIAEHFDRDPDEVLLALIHLAREEKIERRQGGLKGEEV